MKHLAVIFLLLACFVPSEMAAQAKFQAGISNTVYKINKFPQFSGFRTGNLEKFQTFTPGVSLATSIFKRNLRLQMDGLFNNISAIGSSNIHYSAAMDGNLVSGTLDVESSIEYTVSVEYQLLSLFEQGNLSIYLTPSLVHSRSDYFQDRLLNTTVGNLSGDILSTAVALGPELNYKVSKRGSLQLFVPVRLYQINNIVNTGGARFVASDGAVATSEASIFPPNFSLRVGVVYDLVN